MENIINASGLNADRDIIIQQGHITNYSPPVQSASKLLLSHAEYCDSLTQFRRYLLPENLPFVEPAMNSKAHPRAILSRLEALAGKSGVILKGVGGIGKTRTCLEVSRLANEKGWRVLHVLPGEPGVTVEDISVVLFTENTQTLLIFDYLDQMPKLDFGSIRRHLLPEAERRGLRVALLANLRPSSLHHPNAERSALFTDDNNILLQPSTDQKSNITTSALEHIAPLAVTQLGRERVSDLCGERPIIAMFIAEELQHRAQNNSLSIVNVAGFRNGDLLAWLSRRLIDDNLVVGKDIFSQPEPYLIAAAAMLATAPLTRVSTEEVGRRAWQAAAKGSTETAKSVLDGLLSLGWLEERGLNLTAAHDVVADEILAQVIWDRSSDRLREAVLSYCLAPALDSARVFGRFATALTRQLGTETTENEAEVGLREKAGNWLRTHSIRLGQMLARADASESAYALGSIVSAPAWASVCIADWNKLVEPWLNTNGTQVEARHLLYRGLKELPAPMKPNLLLAAIHWLSNYKNLEAASYVVSPLLGRTDLGEHTARAICLAMAWLEYFPLVPEARFVFNPLLGRTDLGEHTARAIELAMAWLEYFPLVQDAGFVFNPLLGCIDLGEHTARAIELAMAWLEHYPFVPEARFVFDPLLSRTDLGEHTACAIELAMAWLEYFPLVPEARFVFEPLLSRTDLGEHTARAIELAMAWLEHYPFVPEAQFVVDRLLERTDLGDHAPRVISISLTRIEQFPSDPEASFVFARLFARTDLGERTARAIEFAMEWLEHYQLAPNAEILVDRLLERTDLGEHAARVISISLTRIEQFPSDPEASFVFERLFARTDLGEHTARAIGLAMVWLEQYPLVPEVSFVLARLFGLPNLNADQRSKCVVIALPHLRRIGSNLEASFLLKACLKDRELEREAAHNIEQFAIDWLKNNSAAEVADYIFNSLLHRSTLDDENWKEISQIAIIWLRTHAKSDGHDFGFVALLKRPHLLEKQDLDWIKKEINQWLIRHPVGIRHNKLQTALNRLEMQGASGTVLKDIGWIDRAVVDQFKLAVHNQAEMPNAEQIEQILASMEFAFNTSRPGPAAYPLPYMLVLVQRVDNIELRKKLITLAKQILHHPNFQSSNRAGLTQSVWQLVDNGAWPETLATPILDELELPRPVLNSQHSKNDYLIDPALVETIKAAMLGQTEIPSIAELDQTINILSVAVEKSRPASAAFPLPYLLVLVHRTGDPELWKKLMILAKQILNHPNLHPRNRSGLTQAIWHIIDNGSWPESIAKPLLEELELSKPNFNYQQSKKNYLIDPAIEDMLKAAVFGQTEVPSINQLDQTIDILAIALEKSRPGAAAFPLPHLLVLVHRANNLELWEKIITLTKNILAHANFQPRNRAGLTRVTWQLVDIGAWPEALAKPVLEDLGLQRPNLNGQLEDKDHSADTLASA